MKLITKAIERSAPALGTTDGTPDKLLIAKFFDPCGRGTWYMAEYDPATGEAFGYCISPIDPDYDEWSYFSIPELQGVRNRLGLGIERDRYFKPCRFSELSR